MGKSVFGIQLEGRIKVAHTKGLHVDRRKKGLHQG